MPKIIIKPEGHEELKTLVKSALENELKIIAIGKKKTIENIQNYERKFKMNSETFSKKYSNGEAGDNFEYIKWAGEIETLEKLDMNIKNLSGAEVC